MNTLAMEKKTISYKNNLLATQQNEIYESIIGINKKLKNQNVIKYCKVFWKTPFFLFH